MEHLSVNNLKQIENEVQLKGSPAKIVVVSKSFEINDILPVINYGHKDFGENRIQEANDKWSNLKKEKKDIKLHFIGKLQTNKVKFLLPLFDYIHSLDSLKLAKKISEEHNQTFLVVTHDDDFAKKSDRIINLKDGKIVD